MKRRAIVTAVAIGLAGCTSRSEPTFTVESPTDEPESTPEPADTPTPESNESNPSQADSETPTPTETPSPYREEALAKVDTARAHIGEALDIWRGDADSISGVGFDVDLPWTTVRNVAREALDELDEAADVLERFGITDREIDVEIAQARLEAEALREGVRGRDLLVDAFDLAGDVLRWIDNRNERLFDDGLNELHLESSQALQRVVALEEDVEAARELGEPEFQADYSALATTLRFAIDTVGDLRSVADDLWKVVEKFRHHAQLKCVREEPYLATLVADDLVGDVEELQVDFGQVEWPRGTTDLADAYGEYIDGLEEDIRTFRQEAAEAAESH